VTIWICRWRMNTLVTSQYQPRLSSIAKMFSRRISQSDWNIQIKLNYLRVTKGWMLLIRHVWDIFRVRVMVMVLKSTFNNISVISWRSVLLVRATGVTRENHRPATSPWQTLSHNVVSSAPCHELDSNKSIEIHVD
jgi:hypothetical protein